MNINNIQDAMWAVRQTYARGSITVILNERLESELLKLFDNQGVKVEYVGLGYYQLSI